MNQALENFITTQNTNYVDDIFNLQNEFLDTLKSAKSQVTDPKMQLYLSNITEIFLGAYIQSTDDVIWSVRGVSPNELESFYKEAIKYKGYMNEYIHILYDNQVEQNKVADEALRRRTKGLINNNLIVTFWSLFFAGIIFYVLGWRIVKNIAKLNDAALSVSKGDFEQKVEIDSNDELSLLADTFNELTTNTKDHIQQIKRTAEIESLLREAELLSLQSQINPHFLFNTLNVVAKTAVIEDAEQTCTLIECVSDMLRYNLKKLNEVSTLQEEISNVENYIYVQKTRFGDRVQFDMNIDPEINKTAIPNLTLQPLVENAFIHGIEDIEEGGGFE